MSLARRRLLISPAHRPLPMVRQCELLSVNRSGLYYQPRGETVLNLGLMRLIDGQFLETPWYGARQMARHMHRLGHVVGRKRMRRLMGVMGLTPIYQPPRTTVPHPGHRVHPYLLRGLAIDRADQVWCADITYIPMRWGFLYLVAVMDWATRKVLSWRLSNTLDVEFCIEAVEEALTGFGRPEIFNTDQGSQFTSPQFTGLLEAARVRISMDGRGRWMDNVFIRAAVAQPEIRVRLSARVRDRVGAARAGLAGWIGYCNGARPHSSLGGRTPDEAYSRQIGAGRNEGANGGLTITGTKLNAE